MAKKPTAKKRTARVRNIEESDESNPSGKKEAAPKKEKKKKEKRIPPGVPLGRNITRAKIVEGEFLSIEYSENIPEHPIADVTRECSARIHGDLQKAIDRLIPHFGFLTELCPNRSANMTFDMFAKNAENGDVFKVLKVTGYTISGPLESRGVTLIGQKILSSGKVVNFISPFQKFDDIAVPYVFAAELSDAISSCHAEVNAYLSGKIAPDPQQKINFENFEEQAQEAMIKNNLLILPPVPAMK